ncbi:MAG: hypothetical protein F6K17_05800 [Okeania sp. SIO3C4]|nr:hypothetical protein [Okeania sp. SIO3C4]
MTLCLFRYCSREILASNFLQDLAPTKTSPVESVASDFTPKSTPTTDFSVI